MQWTAMHECTIARTFLPAFLHSYILTFLHFVLLI
jgi:hypothetical protein